MLGQNEKSNLASITPLGRLHWIHWLVIIVSIALTLAAWYITSLQVQQKSQIQFNYQADQIIQLTKERMGRYEDALLAGIAAIKAQPDGTNANHWKLFSESLSIEDKYPGINGIGVIYLIAPDKLDSFLSQQKRLRPDFTIHPSHNNNEFWPITFIEPVSINQKAVGLDMAHESNRLTAAKQARNTGTSQITAPITLVQDAKKTPGVLFYAPFYQQKTPLGSTLERQQQFIGIVYAPFIMRKLMGGTLQNANRLVNFRISDGQNLLYDEFHPGSKEFDSSPMFSHSISVPMYGREWNFDIQTTALFRSQHKNNQPTLVLFAGIIIDAMLFGLFLTLTQSNKRAYSLARTMTKELKESEHKLSLTIDSMMDGLITLDQYDKILSFNLSAEKIFDIKSGAIIGKNILQLIPVPQDIAQGRYVHQLLGLGITEVEGKRSSGKTFPMEAAVSEMTIGDQSIFTLILRDISERKAADILKNQFVSTVSHELRTPLTSIRGAIGLVLNLGGETFPAKIKSMLDLANRNCKRLNLLINDLLDLEKMAFGSLELDFATIDLIELTREVVKENQGYSLPYQVTLKLTTELPSAFVFADPSRLSQVITNLISNAIKYSPKDDVVLINVERNNSVFRVSVHDNGSGIPTEFRERIFHRFAQADSSDTREKGGTGLGLSICKAIIEEHQGIIDYSSEKNSGTLFYFELAEKKR